MADKHIADKESKFVAVNGPPDFCIVGKDCIPFDITDKLSNARDPSSNVYARGVAVLTQGTRINTVDGDAGKGVASGCSKGHTIVLSGSNTVFTNGKPTAFHLSKVCMNCNGADVPNTTGELRTTAVAPKPQLGSKDKGQELKDQNRANNEALHNNPNGKTQEEARALQSKVNQTFADATRHEKAAMDALRKGGSVDVYGDAIQTSTTARNMLAEAERQVRFANPTSKAMAEVLVSQIPGSGLVDAGKDFAQASQQAGQGNYLSAAGSAVMGVFSVVTEAPGLKQIKGVFKGGKAIDKLGDAKKAADLKKAQDAEQARQSGVVIEKATDAKQVKKDQLKKNQKDGKRREKETEQELKEKYPDAKVENERYLRDENGKIVKDPLTGEARRLDHVVTQDGKVIDIVETTSSTVDKAAQLAKEGRIIENGGTFIRDRATRELLPIGEASSRIITRP